jgi:hypothetical protein
MRCQSRIPKSSLDSVLVTFPRGSAALTGEAREFLDAVGKALQARESCGRPCASKAIPTSPAALQ